MKTEKVIEYILSIYQPGLIGGEPWVTFKSESPFMSIHKGDYISAGFTNDTFPQSKREPILQKSGSGVKVKAIEHSIVFLENGTGISHKVLVFTEESENLWDK